jgi:hypothetical protein
MRDEGDWLLAAQQRARSWENDEGAHWVRQVYMAMYMVFVYLS